MFENRYLKRIQDIKIKEELQFKLYKGINIYYSNNQRGIPDASHVEDGNYYIVNPNEYQLAFTSFRLDTIEEVVNKIYNKEDIKELRELWFNNSPELEEVLKEDSAQQSQYTYEDILEYFILFFNIEDDLKQYNFKNESNRQEAIRIILMLSIKGYEVKVDAIKTLVNNYLEIKIKENRVISGEILISLDEDYRGIKNILLVDDTKKELLKDDLNITIYGDVTNKIEGTLPFNRIKIAI